jgi:hypothetical protein
VTSRLLARRCLNAALRKAVELTAHHVVVNDGRNAIGEVLIGRTIRVDDATCNELGTFSNRDETTRAALRGATAAGRSK